LGLRYPLLELEELLLELTEGNCGELAGFVWVDRLLYTLAPGWYMLAFTYVPSELLDEANALDLSRESWGEGEPATEEFVAVIVDDTSSISDIFTLVSCFLLSVDVLYIDSMFLAWISLTISERSPTDSKLPAEMLFSTGFGDLYSLKLGDVYANLEFKLWLSLAVLDFGGTGAAYSDGGEKLCPIFFLLLPRGLSSITAYILSPLFGLDSSSMLARGALPSERRFKQSS